MRCGICMDRRQPLVKGAPCGFAGAWFHSECLVRLQDAQGLGNWRCPHCNVPVRDADLNDKIVKLTVEQIGALVDGWMQRDGYWSTKPFFVKVQQGLQYGEHETNVLTGVVAMLVEKLKKQAVCCVKVVPSENASTHCFSCILARRACRFSLTLRRTAFLGKQGCVVCDGYTVCARRARASVLRR